MRINVELTESQIRAIERIKEDLGTKTNTKMFLRLIDSYEHNKRKVNAYHKLAKILQSKKVTNH